MTPFSHFLQIRTVSAPFFLLTKFEAFDGRGRGDYIFSHDIEDIIAVIDGRSTIVNEVKAAPSELITALAGRLEKLVNEQLFLDAISGHLPSDPVSQARAGIGKAADNVTFVDWSFVF